MTPGDEAGALKEEETQVDSEVSGADAHDDPAPAEPDPGAEETKQAPAKDEVETDAEAVEDEAPAAEDTASEDVVSEDAASESEDGEAAEAEAEPAAAAGDADFDDEDDDENPRPAGVWAASVVVLVLLLIAGAVTAFSYWGKASSASADSSGRQAAISTAETAVTDLFTIDYKNPDAFAARLKPLAAGQFLGVVENSTKGVASLLQKGQVQTTGKAELAGVESFHGDTAQVAVLGAEIIKNSQAPQGSQRSYRMVLSMVKSGSKWVVSNLEFVQ